jgi:superfamily I DNA/RNA helicase
VDAWQLRSWEAYRDVARLGRKTRLGGRQRQTLWAIFERVLATLAARGVVTPAETFARVTDRIAADGQSPFDHVVVDEAQDVSVPEFRFLAALGGTRADGLYFTGDLGQRIFRQPFSWKALGVDIRGRSHTLRINYRTSHQIRSQADRLLPSSVADVDGIEESRRGTQSVFNGPPPVVAVLEDTEEEIAHVAAWMQALDAGGVLPGEIGLFVRTRTQLDRALRAVEAAGFAAAELTESLNVGADEVAVGTMHLAKGLEFKAVAVMACDDEVLPLQARIETVTDMADLDDIYATERHLLYVACTRARDHLLVTGVDPASEFLDDVHP